MIDQKAIEFQRLHRPGNCFIMANAWNAGSAVLLEQGSFNFANEQIPDAELSKLFSGRTDS